MKCLFSLVIGLTFLLASKSWATVTLTVASGVSKSDGSGVAYNIYAGFAYATGYTPSNFTGCSSGVCNTCTATPTPLAPCNHTSVFLDATTLNLGFSVAATVAGSSWKVCQTANQSVDLTSNLGLTGQTGSTLSINGVTWNTFCGYLGMTGCTSGTATVTVGYATAAQSCSTMTDLITLKFYISNHVVTGDETSDASTATTAANPATAFTLFEGDSKVYIVPDTFAFPPNVSGSTPSVGSTGLLYSNIVFLSGQGDSIAAANVTNASTSNSISIDQTNSLLATDFIGGLENDVKYCFRMASEDNTGVISFYSSDTTAQCKTPSEVVGLLADKKCFIATAAYGSNLDPHVTTFRKFRNEFLLSSWLGRAFVKTYYKYSPALAGFISEHENLRSIVRILLWPLLGFVELTLAWGIWAGIVALLLGVWLARFALRKTARVL